MLLYGSSPRTVLKRVSPKEKAKLEKEKAKAEKAEKAAEKENKKRKK